MRISSPRITVRLALALALVAAGLCSAGVDRAQAMSQPQTNPATVVNAVYGDLAYVWDWNLRYFGYRFSHPTVRYYGYQYNGQTVTLPTACGTGNWAYGQYCATDGVLGLRWPDLVNSINRYGDGAVALWISHEFAHHVQAVSAEESVGQARELEADCMAGMFFGLEVGWGRNLDHQDAVEAYYQLNDQPSSTSHGSGAQRAAAFWSGYVDKSWPSCDTRY